ncbi:MAG: hypothetical protein RR562_00545 [Longicatena sp.]
MKELYFSDIWAIISTCLLVVLLVYVGMVLIRRKEIVRWNKHVYSLIGIGLVLCCFVVMRDRYVESVQGGEGVFLLDSIQILSAYVLAMCIGGIALVSFVIRKKKYQKIMFYILTCVILCKVLIIEISRVIC